MNSVALGAAAFWIAVASVIIASLWFRSRSEAQKHETLRRIVEKTGQVDEAQLKALIGAQAHRDWMTPPSPRPGSGYRTLRVLGTLVLFTAGGMAIFFTIITVNVPNADGIIGLAVTAIVAMFGAGLLFASRFLERPPGS